MCRRLLHEPHRDFPRTAGMSHGVRGGPKVACWCVRLKLDTVSPPLTGSPIRSSDTRCIYPLVFAAALFQRLFLFSAHGLLNFFIHTALTPRLLYLNGHAECDEACVGYVTLLGRSRVSVAQQEAAGEKEFVTHVQIVMKDRLSYPSDFFLLFSLSLHLILKCFWCS